MKKALITGITGQDGAYLTKFLINKGYEVHGMRRRASSCNTYRIDQMYEDSSIKEKIERRMNKPSSTSRSNTTL